MRFGLVGLFLACFAAEACAQTDSKAILSSLAVRPNDKQLLRDLKAAIAQTQDSNLKAKLGTIYCLGCLVTGQEQEWSQTYVQIKKFNPTNEYVNLLSLEAIGDVCPECRGATYTYKDCTRCKGTGKCTSCDGKGKVSAKSGGAERPCIGCKGSGECSGCEGSGAIKTACTKCSDKGAIWSPTAANEIYLKLLKATPLKDLQADVNERKNLQAQEIEKTLAIRSKEKEYRKILKTMDEKEIHAKLKIVKVSGQGALVTGTADGAELPQQFLVDQLKDVVDGDKWEGKIYPMGRVQVRGPMGVATLRVYSASKEQAARATLMQQEQEKSGQKPPGEGPSTGTGWFCGTGHIVTCHHVVGNRAQLFIVSESIGKTPVKLILKDESHDLAILEPTEAIKVPPGIPLAKEPPQLGEDAFTIGFPHIGLLGKEPKFTDGTISSLMGMKDDPRTLQMSVPVQAGNSGGPLMNFKGEVIGIVASKLAAANIFRWTGDLPQNVNYAVKVQHVQKLLDVVPGAKKTSLLPADKAAAVDLAKRVQDSIVQVLAE
jgi:S1-C subfamily serine protease